MKYKIVRKERNYMDIISILLYGSSIVVSTIFGYINHESLAQVGKMTIFSVLLVTMLLWILENVRKKIRWNEKKVKVFLASYIVSLILLFLSNHFELYHLWLIGSISISAWIHPYLGAGIHFVFTILYSILQNISMDQFSYYLLLGIILCILVPYLRKKKNIIYIFITGLCVQMSLFFVMENFTLYHWQDLIVSCIITISILILIVLCLNIKNMDIKKDNWSIAKIRRKEKEKNIHNMDQEVEEISLDQMLDREFDLIKQLSAFSPKLYLHSMEVAELSKRVIEQIGGNAKLAQAGGLYHEIGRIQSNHYIVEGIKLAKEYQFPEAVIDIIRQHHVKTEKPRSLEAAAVMLADSILSTMEYMKEKRPEEQIDKNEIIENIFALRLQKGVLDESGVTTDYYNKFKKFFQENI